MSKPKLGNYTLKAVMIWGDTIYERELGCQHWYAAIWNLFPPFREKEAAWKKWATKIYPRKEHLP